MTKNSEFDEIYSEEDIDFNTTNSKLRPTQEKSALHQLVMEGSNLSTIAKTYLNIDGRSQTIKKRKSEAEAFVQESKISNYRERSKNRFTVANNLATNIFQRPESEEKIKEKDIHRTNEEPLEMVETKPSFQQSQSPLKGHRPIQKDNIINQKALPRVVPKTEGYDKIIKKNKILPRSIAPIENKSNLAKDSQQRAVRMQKLQRARQILSGKLSIVWIFAISSEIDSQTKDRIYDVYKGLLDDSNIVPFVKHAWEIEPFLSLPNAYFKIVSNIANTEDVLRYKINVKVVEFYIYNDEGELGMSQALEFKSWSRKIKGIYTNLEHIVDKTEQEIQDTIHIYKYNNGLEASIQQVKFPSFLKLTGKDKSEATLYRGNLYGAINLTQADKVINYEYFLMLVREKYGSLQKQKANIVDYIKIRHLKPIKSLPQAKQIISFYVRQSFYYQIVNSMLRTLKTTEEFKPCILPFNQTYHSINMYYKQILKQNQRVMPAMTLYRGAKLKRRDFKSLVVGDFIEMYGFMSTSKSRASAQKFTDNEGYLFVIHVKERTMLEKYDKYDHGFVDINRFGLATKQLQGQEEVLFNALNIYKVTGIDDSGRNILIHIEYGAIFDLLDKPKQALSSDERDVLINYQYCTKMMGEIQDQGDVYLLSNQYDEAKDYYIGRINKNGQDANNYFKLANVQKQCGEIDQAEKNGLKSLEILTKKLNLTDRQTCLKVFSIHSRNAEINMQKEDYLSADEELTKGIELLDDSDIFNKAKKIRERGEIKFKKGEVKDAEKDFWLSQKLFNDVEKKGDELKWDVKKKYLFSFLTLWCSQITKQQIEAQRQEELQRITEVERQIYNMKEEIEDQLIKVNKSLKDVAIYAQDKQTYEYCVKKGRAYLLNLQQRETNDPIIKARLKVMEATIQDYLDLAESEILLMSAIALVESQAPFDPSVGEYSTILAKLQKKQLQKLTNPEQGMRLDPSKQVQYNEAEQKAIYNRCKNNFKKAINILLYNRKARDSPEVITLRNQLGELEFGQNDFQSCEEIIQEIKADAAALEHTEISKSSLMLGKIAFLRGELKNSFKILEESDLILQRVLIKSKQNPKYILIYQKSDIYLEILLMKSKVFHRQTQHDLALKHLTLLEQKLDQKMEGYESHSMMASVYEEFGEVKANLRQRQFLDYFEKAIQLRKRQMGQYNIFNAVSYCNYSKYLMIANEVTEAEEQLSRAVQIFSCLSNDHPINWVIYFSNGIFSELKEQYIEADKLFKNSLKMAEKKFDHSHITIKKVRLKIAKVLLKLGDIEQSFKELQSLQENVEQDLKQSRTKVEVIEETDDEKITLEKIILTELKIVIEKQENNLRFSQIEIDKYKRKYEDLRRTFRLDDEPKE